MVIINPQESLPIRVDLMAENVNVCFINIKYDTNHLELAEGTRSEDLGRGSFSKRLSGVLKATKISRKSLWIEITLEAGDLFQVVGFNKKIKKTRNRNYEFKN